MCLTLLVLFELHVRLGPYKSHLLSDGDNLGKEECVDAFVLVLGQDADEEHVEDRCGLEVDSFGQVPPTEGEQFAVGFLESVGQRPMVIPTAMGSFCSFSTTASRRRSRKGR